MLYRPAAFEPLTGDPWDEERVREAIREIVADTDDALRGPRLLWRARLDLPNLALRTLERVRRLRAARGRGRYSLWTGDLGVALYAADCLDGRAMYPILDS